MARDPNKQMVPGQVMLYSGALVTVHNLLPEDIDPIDIATSLANQCRYNGHVRRYYSVAQHSVIVSDLCAPENKKWGLLHDAAEAYIGDIVAPLKYMPDFDFFRELEDQIMLVICERFDLDPIQPDEVTHWDHELREPEMRDLKGRPSDTTLPMINPLEPQQARARYINRLLALKIIDESRRYE